MSDDVIFCDELHYPDSNRTLRLTVDRDGCVFLTIENQTGLLSPTTMIGGAGLLIWLQAQSEAAMFAVQRKEAA